MYYRFNKSFCKPTQIWFFSTIRGCLKCKFCDSWKIEDSRDKELSTEECKNLLKVLRSWLGSYFLSISGGEPFLREDILDIVKFASSMGIKARITTNGFLLNQKLCNEILSSGFHSLTIGLDSIRPDVHDYVRGVHGAYQRAVWAIDYLNRYRNKMLLRICTVLMKPNLDDILSLVDWVEERGIDSIIFLPFQERLRKEDPESDHDKKLEFCWIQDTAKLEWVVDNLIQRKKYGSPIFNSFAHLRSMKKYYASTPSKSQTKCLSGLENLMIDSYGNVHLCRRSDLIDDIGNTKAHNVRELWKSEKAKSVRARIKDCKTDCLLDPYCNRSLHEKINLLLFLLKKRAA